MLRFRLLEKFNFWGLVLGLVLLLPALSQAAEVPVFGPETFAPAGDDDISINRTFNVPRTASGQLVLSPIIPVGSHGDDDDGDGGVELEELRIKLNGTTILNLDDEEDITSDIIVPVSLLSGTNTLNISMDDDTEGSFALTVNAFDEAPTAAFTATPNSGTVPFTVAFDATVSTDPDNDIATYAWDFGDGSTGSGVTTSHEYTAAGIFTVTLTVTDVLGLAATATASIEGISIPQVAPVVFSPDPATGPFQEFVTITLTTATPDARIHFTADGSIPSSNNGMIFTGPFDLIATATLKAIAVKPGLQDSVVSSADYTVNVTPQVEPVTFSPRFQVFPTSMDVTLSTVTPDATIHFTVDGTDPTTASPIFTTPLTLTQTTTIKALAVKQGFLDSSITSTTRTLESDLPFPIPIPPISFTAFDFVEVKGRFGHESLLPIAGLPIQGTDQMAEARLHGPVDTAAFRLVTPMGTLIQSIDLSQPLETDPLSGLYLGTVQFPNQPFQVAASGLNFDGTSYDVTFPTVFETKTVGFHNLISPLFLKQGTSTITADLTNHGNQGIFTVTATDNQGFIASVTPTSITLGTGETGQVQVELLVPLETPEPTEVNVTLTATDTTDPAISNVADESFLVVIFPTITPPADITMVSTGPLTPVDIGTASATDNFGIHSITNDAPVDGFPVGMTEVKWTAMDTGGNESSAIQVITITSP